MIVNGAAVLRSRTTPCGGQSVALIERTVKYIANSAAKNISSLDSHTIVPTLTTLGRIREPCEGTLSSAVADATSSSCQNPWGESVRPPGAAGARFHADYRCGCVRRGPFVVRRASAAG